MARLPQKKNKKMPDLSKREAIVLIPLLVVIFWIGLYPKPFFDLLNPTVENLVALLQSAALAMH